MKNDIRYMLFIFLTAVLFMIAACGVEKSPADAVEAYLGALENKDEVQAVSLSCAEWEETARAEGESFMTVEVELQDANCSVVEQSENTALVSCEGRFVFSYDAGEDLVLELSTRFFKVVKEGDQWLMCGYR